MAHFNFVISQNAKWGHAGFYIDCHRMTVPENILLQKKHCSGSSYFSVTLTTVHHLYNVLTWLKLGMYQAVQNNNNNNNNNICSIVSSDNGTNSISSNIAP